MWGPRCDWSCLKLVIFRTTHSLCKASIQRATSLRWFEVLIWGHTNRRLRIRQARPRIPVATWLTLHAERHATAIVTIVAKSRSYFVVLWRQNDTRAHRVMYRRVTDKRRWWDAMILEMCAHINAASNRLTPLSIILALPLIVLLNNEVVFLLFVTWWLLCLSLAQLRNLSQAPICFGIVILEAFSHVFRLLEKSCTQLVPCKLLWIVCLVLV